MCSEVRAWGQRRRRRRAIEGAAEVGTHVGGSAPIEGWVRHKSWGTCEEASVVFIASGTLIWRWWGNVSVRTAEGLARTRSQATGLASRVLLRVISAGTSLETGEGAA
eukprot:scaffold317102_cov37-Tisochrysis_lutea.AAC.2